ncbi:hypothetical protein BGZ58_006752, partial [Dissophora ornata]
HLFKTTKGIATYMVGCFVEAVEKIGRTEIWNKHRRTGKSYGITAMGKRAEERNCIGEHRRNSNDFKRPILRQRQALNVKEIYKVANER